MSKYIRSNTDAGDVTMRAEVEQSISRLPAMVMAYVSDKCAPDRNLHTIITPAAAREYAAQLVRAADEADAVNANREIWDWS
jgi:hypothetical protein